MGRSNVNGSKSTGKSDDTTEKVENEKWTTQMDRVLIDALIVQNDIGNRINGTFTSMAYDTVVKEINEKLGREFNKQHVKNRLKTIKKNFSDCYDVFKGGMSGFAWSPITKMWDAEPEVWKSLFEAKPEARRWMNTPVPNYDKLEKLYGKDRANGMCAETAKEKARRWAMEQEQTVESGNGGFTLEEIEKMVTEDYDMIQNFQGVNVEHSSTTTPNEATSEVPTKSTTSSVSKKRKAIDDLKIAEAMQEFSLTMKEGNEILKKRNEIAEKSQPRLYSEEEIYEELRKLGFDEEIRMTGYSFLVENPAKARAFFGYPSEERARFLFFQLRSARIII